VVTEFSWFYTRQGPGYHWKGWLVL
jgi:hypothetical protein